MTGRATVDAVVVGGGVNGLVAATTLADAGWDVELVEASELGGAVRSTRRRPGTVTDLFSAFYPLAAASPVLGGLGLEEHGLRWSHAPTVLAHPVPDAPSEAALLHRDPDRTADALDADHPGDGARWLQLVAEYHRLREPLLDALFTPFPPVRPGLRLARVLGAAGALRTARFLTLPVRRMGQELFGGRHGQMLLAGNALHADVPPTSPGSGMFAWLLCMLAQDVGFPVPVGGAQRLTDALVARAEAAGVRVSVGDPVTAVEVRAGRATGVRLAGGTRVQARRGVLAALDARHLFGRLVPADALPPQVVADLSRFEGDLPTVKVNWVLPRTPAWLAEGARTAGTLHVGADADGAVRWSADVETGVVPRNAFLLVGQMTTADATRSAEGMESLWAYTHLPRTSTVRRIGADRLREQVDRTVDAMTEQLERHAPGALDGALDRFVQGPADLVAEDPNLLDGTLNGGTAQLHQQLVLRPVPGLGGARTPLRGLYLAGSSAHPGGGVHGACGWNAARTCLADHGPTGPLRRALLTRLERRI